MQNKIVAFILIAGILLSCSIGASASVPYTEDFARELVRELEIMVGDSAGNMNLEAGLTRAEFTTIAIAASKYKNSVAHGAKISVFKDCNYKHWAAPYVKVAVTNGLISGYPDGTFRPDTPVTYEEAFVVALKLLGYTSEDFGNTWPYGQVSLGKSLGLGANIQKGIGDYITRGEALVLMYNTLNAKVKGSNNEYISELDATLYENVIVIATNNEDTSIAPGSVMTSAGTFKYNSSFDVSSVGSKGDLAVKNNGEVVCFVPYKQRNSKYVVYSILSDSVIVYDNGNLTELDMSNNTTVYSGADKLTFSSVKSQMSIGDVVYVVKNAQGAVEYLTLTKDSLRGPETLNSYSQNWYKAFTDDLSTLTVMRNGEKVDYTELKQYDVLYYSKDLNTVYAYAKTTTGIYEKAIPNKDTPTSVVISGTEYQIESVNAFNKLSSSGNISYGTSVTLLFGKDGKIADAIDAEENNNDGIVGYLVAAGKKTFENINGESYTSPYVTLIMPDGSSVEYTTDSDYSSIINSVVRINFSGDSVKVYKVIDKSLSGYVNSKEKSVGSYKVDDGVQILDVSSIDPLRETNWTTIYMQRLDGITLNSSSVLWYNVNKQGKIDKIILNYVTGDTSLYGIATQVAEKSYIYDVVGEPDTYHDNKPNDDILLGSYYSSKNYSFDVNGQDFKYTPGGAIKNIIVGTPTELKVSSSGTVSAVIPLKLINGNVKSISYTKITVSNINYKISDQVLVYKKVDNSTYSLIPLSELIEKFDSYTVKAYYDKKESSGGRIRVLIATPK